MMTIAENFWVLVLVLVLVVAGLGYRLGKRRSRGELNAGPLQEAPAAVDGLLEHSWDLAAIEWSLQHQPEVTAGMLRELCARAGVHDMGRPMVGSAAGIEPERLVAVLESHLGMRSDRTPQSQTPQQNRESEHAQ